MDSQRMTKESVWACELSSSKQTYQWNVADDLSEDEVEITRSLLVKHAVLGHEAKDGEVTVVQLETVDAEGETIKLPVVLLRAGKIDNCTLDLVVHHAGAKFSLAKGSGPVYIWGQLIEDFGSVGELDSGEEDDEEDKAELADEMNDLAKESAAAAAANADSKKRKLPGPPEKGNPKKVAKVDEHGDGDDDEMDSEEDEEESDAEEESPPKKGPKGKAAAKVVPAANAKAVRGRKK